MANYAEAYDWLYRNYGPVAKFARPFPAIVFFEPKDFSHFLKKNAQNYAKSHHYEIFRRFLGDGLVTNDGETWKTHRRLMAPEFHLSRVKDFTDVMVRRTQVLEALWEKAADTGEVRNLEKDLSQITLFIVGEALFGTDTDESHRRFPKTFMRDFRPPLPKWCSPFSFPSGCRRSAASAPGARASVLIRSLKKSLRCVKPSPDKKIS